MMLVAMKVGCDGGVGRDDSSDIDGGGNVLLLEVVVVVMHQLSW